MPASTQLLRMLQETRRLVVKYNERNGHRRLYLPIIRWRQWLSTGTQDEEALPASGRKAARQGSLDATTDDAIDQRDGEPFLSKTKSRHDVEEAIRSPELQLNALSDHEIHRPRCGASGVETKCDALSKGPPTDGDKTRFQAARESLNDLVNWVHDSEDIAYALKVTIAGMLVLWPAFVPGLNEWYYDKRGGREFSMCARSNCC